MRLPPTGGTPLNIADARWTPKVNMLVVWCPCGEEFEHRADRWRVVCPFCGEQDDLRPMRDRYLAKRRPVVHCKREPFDVYIGRPSKWGNPFAIGRDGDRAEVIAKYEEWVQTQPDLMAALPELRGKVLGCWCAPKACHGDVLARLANESK